MWIFFSIHVDDFAVAGTHQKMIDQLCETLRKKYTITVSDNLESFLGIQITKSGESLYLSQPGHIAKIVEEANVENETETKTPMATDLWIKLHLLR